MENLLKRQIAGVIVNETDPDVMLKIQANDQSGHKWSVVDYWFPKSALTKCAPFSEHNIMFDKVNKADIKFYDVANWFVNKSILDDYITKSNGWSPAYNIVDPHFINNERKN